MENPIKMDDLGGPLAHPYFWKHQFFLMLNSCHSLSLPIRYSRGLVGVAAGAPCKTGACDAI